MARNYVSLRTIPVTNQIKTVLRVSKSSRFSRYCAPSVLGSWVWPFKVTWGHRSRDHL